MADIPPRFIHILVNYLSKKHQGTKQDAMLAKIVELLKS